MRDVNRIDSMLESLNVLWSHYPNMRLCQLLSYMAVKSGWKDNDLFNIEDDVINKQIQEEIMRIEGLSND